MCSVGTVRQHVDVSTGGETSLDNHYVTTNKYTYGSFWKGFQPILKSHQGAGYVSNTRPVFQYTEHLDDIDNPLLKKELKYNYLTETADKYVSYRRKYGGEILPANVHHASESINLLKCTHESSKKQLKQIFRTEKFLSAGLPLYEHHRPLLYKIQHKDQLEQENLNNGPAHMSTTYSMQFGPFNKHNGQNIPAMIGRKEPSGFVENNKTVSTISQRPHLIYDGKNPGWMTRFPTGQTSYQSDYDPRHWSTKTDIYPTLCNGTAGGEVLLKESGFTGGNKGSNHILSTSDFNVFVGANNLPPKKLAKLKSSDKSEYWNAIYAKKSPSITQCSFLGEIQNPPSHEKNIGNSSVGKKEETGITRNLKPYFEAPELNKERFVTHNMTTYYWTAPRSGHDRQGCLNFNTFPAEQSMFQLSAKNNKFEKQTDILQKLPELKNYQARSIIKREEYVAEPNKMEYFKD